mmetsp:Transcript_31174/g.81755  ORF Transcript_31174/g.81755 Transcript_31174/m.81755 type:complete len:259 (-) Transcript_31174:268-1044(-)
MTCPSAASRSDLSLGGSAGEAAATLPVASLCAGGENGGWSPPPESARASSSAPSCDAFTGLGRSTAALLLVTTWGPPPPPSGDLCRVDCATRPRPDRLGGTAAECPAPVPVVARPMSATLISDAARSASSASSSAILSAAAACSTRSTRTEAVEMVDAGRSSGTATPGARSCAGARPSIARTTPSCLYCVARSRAVTPCALGAAAVAPPASSSSTMSRRPSRAAKWRARIPDRAGTSGSAPEAMRIRTTSLWPPTTAW